MHSEYIPGSARDRWERRYREEPPPRDPSPFLRSIAPLLPRRGRALDLAGGGGRHAILLASTGLDVTLADISPAALAIARERAGALPLATLEWDAEARGVPPGPWDLVVVFHFLWRPLLAGIPRALAPGGLFVWCHPTRRNLERHPRPGPDHLLEEGEMRRLAEGLEILLHEEGWLDEGRHEARVVARRLA